MIASAMQLAWSLDSWPPSLIWAAISVRMRSRSPSLLPPVKSRPATTTATAAKAAAPIIRPFFDPDDAALRASPVGGSGGIGGVRPGAAGHTLVVSPAETGCVVVGSPHPGASSTGVVGSGGVGSGAAGEVLSAAAAAKASVDATPALET